MVFALLLAAACLPAGKASAAEISVEARSLSTSAVLSLQSEQVGVLAASDSLRGAALAGCEVRELAKIDAKAAFPGADDEAPLVAEIKREAGRRGSNVIVLELGGRFEDSGKLAQIAATGYRIECEGGLLDADEILASTSAWPTVAERRLRKKLESNPTYARLKRLAATAGCRWVRDNFSVPSPALENCADYSAAMSSITPSTATVAALDKFFSIRFSTGTLADFFHQVETGKDATEQARLRMQLEVARSARDMAAELVASPDWPAFIRQYREVHGEAPPDPVAAFDRQATGFIIRLEKLKLQE